MTVGFCRKSRMLSGLLGWSEALWIKLIVVFVTAARSCMFWD